MIADLLRRKKSKSPLLPSYKAVIIDSKSMKELDDAALILAPYQDIQEYDKNVIAGIIKKVIVHAVDRVEVVWKCRDEYE